jgi:TetR/AcrR family transcriptional regulator
MAPKAASRTSPRTGKRLSRRHDSAVTRRALVDAGGELFAAHGFDAVTVAEVARRAGVNQALINYHFGGKLALYRTIVRDMYAEFLARVEPLRHDSRPPGEVLREFIAIVGTMASTERPHLPAMLLREVIAGGPHLDQDTLAYPMRVFAVVRDIVARGVRERVFRPVDPFLAHLSLVGSLVFFFATAEFRRRMAAEKRIPIEPPAADAYVGHIQELLARGLALDRA